MQLNKSSAERRLAELFMDDMPVMEFTVRSVPVSTDWFARYKIIRTEFLRSLTDSIEDLAFLNLSQEEFIDLIMGKKIPNNISIRFRIPLIYGGKLDIENLFLCKTFSNSHNLDRFIIEQSGSATIWLPNPQKKVYVSAHTATGGAGGNATEDRLSQMSAQFAASRGME